MANFITRTINSKFEITDGGVEHASAEAAYSLAITAGLGIAADEIIAGEGASMVELSVEQADGRVVARGAVSIVASSLFISEKRPTLRVI